MTCYLHVDRLFEPRTRSPANSLAETVKLATMDDARKHRASRTIVRERNWLSQCVEFMLSFLECVGWKLFDVVVVVVERRSLDVSVKTRCVPESGPEAELNKKERQSSRGPRAKGP